MDDYQTNIIVFVASYGFSSQENNLAHGAE